MNQTNILVAASSVAALLTLGVVTFTRWVDPWVPLAIGAGWVALWAGAWATLKAVGDVDVPDSPTEAMPALVAVALVPLVSAVWLVPTTRVAVTEPALSNSADAVEAIFKDSSSDVRLAACAAAPDVDPAQWSAISDAIAAQPELALQCSQSLTPGLVDAIADRWATAVKRPNMDEATACMLTEKLAQLRDGKPEVLTRDLMHCAAQAKTEAAKACCKQTFDASVEPIALLEAGTPSPRVLASFINVHFKPGEPLEEELAGRLIDATCESHEDTTVTSAYWPYVEEQCGAKADGWGDGYGTDMWDEACSEQLPYFRQVEKAPLDEAFCRGMETAAVAIAIEEARVSVAQGRADGRSKEGVSPGVLSDVASTARARGAGTRGAGIDQEETEKRLPPEFMWGRRQDLIIRAAQMKSDEKCREAVRDSFDVGMEEMARVRPGAESAEDIIGFDPCDPDEDALEKYDKLINQDDDDSELEEEDIDAEALMEQAPNAKAAQKTMEELVNTSGD